MLERGCRHCIGFLNTSSTINTWMNVEKLEELNKPTLVQFRTRWALLAKTTKLRSVLEALTYYLKLNPNSDNWTVFRYPIRSSLQNGFALINHHFNLYQELQSYTTSKMCSSVYTSKTVRNTCPAGFDIVLEWVYPTTAQVFHPSCMLSDLQSGRPSRSHKCGLCNNKVLQPPDIFPVVEKAGRERGQPSEEGYSTQQLPEMRKKLPNRGVRSELKNLLTMSPPCVCWVNGEKLVGQERGQPSEEGYSTQQLPEMRKKLPNRGVRSELKNLLTMSPPCVCWVNGEKLVGQVWYMGNTENRPFWVSRWCSEQRVRLPFEEFWVRYLIGPRFRQSGPSKMANNIAPPRGTGRAAAKLPHNRIDFLKAMTCSGFQLYSVECLHIMNHYKIVDIARVTKSISGYDEVEGLAVRINGGRNIRIMVYCETQKLTGCNGVGCKSSLEEHASGHPKFCQDRADIFRHDLQIPRQAHPRFVSYLMAHCLGTIHKWAVQARFGMPHFKTATNNCLKNAKDRLKNRVHCSDTMKHTRAPPARRTIDAYAGECICPFYQAMLHPCIYLSSAFEVSRFQAVRDLFSGCFFIHQRWLLDYSLPAKGVPLTFVSKPPPAALNGRRKQLNRVRLILLRQGSIYAADDRPSAVEDTAPQPGWWFRILNWAFVCSVTSRLVPATSDAQRIAYHITSIVVMVNLARCTVILFRLAPKVQRGTTRQLWITVTNTTNAVDSFLDPNAYCQTRYRDYPSRNNLPNSRSSPFVYKPDHAPHAFSADACPFTAVGSFCTIHSFTPLDNEEDDMTDNSSYNHMLSSQINSLPHYEPHSITSAASLIADETNVAYTLPSIVQAISLHQIQQELESVTRWSNDSGLSLSSAKSQIASCRCSLLADAFTISRNPVTQRTKNMISNNLVRPAFPTKSRFWLLDSYSHPVALMSLINTGRCLQSSMNHNRCGRNDCPSNVRRGMQCHTCKACWHFKCTGLREAQMLRSNRHTQGETGASFRGPGGCKQRTQRLGRKFIKSVFCLTRTWHYPSLVRWLRKGHPALRSGNEDLQGVSSGQARMGKRADHPWGHSPEKLTKQAQSLLDSVLTKPDHESLHAHWTRQKGSKITLGLLVTISSSSALQKILERAVGLQRFSRPRNYGRTDCNYSRLCSRKHANATDRDSGYQFLLNHRRPPDFQSQRRFKGGKPHVDGEPKVRRDISASFRNK
ncbi:hypothetical protein CLF_107501 [Clonorchis sinensis]|uniref:Uncharacterized protein n=1 Tax=Clonorchis sinensis TaxID=79923 RepID=G7YQN1_CLOSI|nr:hypothetical protein CLF_107501 [Clonorchis sinensis]